MNAASSTPSRGAIDLERPILIIGVGRSGTSLLQSMLNAHPDLCFPPETHFFRRYVATQRGRDLWNREEKQHLVCKLQQDESFARANIDPVELLQDPLSGSGPLGVFRALLSRVAQQQGKSRVGDKDPKNIDSLAALRRAFPQAFVIHVIRDPRDVLLSRTKAEWSAHRPWWMHPLIYREQLRRGRALGKRLFGDRYFELRYEELIADPETTLRRLCVHADLTWTPVMLEFGASAAQLVDEREMSWKRETLGPLLTKNSGKWRTSLTSGQVAFCEAICRETFEAFGYEATKPVRAFLRAIASVLRTLMTAAYGLKMGQETR